MFKVPSFANISTIYYQNWLKIKQVISKTRKGWNFKNTSVEICNEHDVDWPQKLNSLHKQKLEKFTEMYKCMLNYCYYNNQWISLVQLSLKEKQLITVIDDKELIKYSDKMHSSAV